MSSLDRHASMMHAASMQTVDLLTTTEAGVLLRKSARTVQRLAESGEIPVALKLPGPNGAYLIRRADVERLAGAKGPS